MVTIRRCLQFTAAWVAVVVAAACGWGGNDTDNSEVRATALSAARDKGRGEVRGPPSRQRQGPASRLKRIGSTFRVSPAILEPFPAFRVYESFAKAPGATNTGSVDRVANFGAPYLDTFANPTGDGLLGLALVRPRHHRHHRRR